MVTSHRAPPCRLAFGWLASVLAFEMAAIGPSPAVAGDPETLIREGIELRRAGDDVSALKRFEQAYDLEKTPRALAQVGLAEQALGRWATADRHLRQAIQSGDDPWIRKYRAAIDQALGVVSNHVGKLDVRGIPTGAEVRVDGELVGRLPLTSPILVTAGGVAIEVRAAGYLPIARTTSVTAGLLTRETFTLQRLMPTAEATTQRERPSGPPTEPVGTGSASVGSTPFAENVAPPSQAPPSDEPRVGSSAGGSRGGQTVLTLTAAGLSAISLAFGIVEHLSWQRKVSSFGAMSNCGGNLPDKGSAGCKQLYDDGQRARLLAFVGYGASAAFAATALILHLTNSPSSSDSRRVACAGHLTGPGLTCSLRF